MASISDGFGIVLPCLKLSAMMHSFEWHSLMAWKNSFFQESPCSLHHILALSHCPFTLAVSILDNLAWQS
jgi:hypothetical protein